MVADINTIGGVTLDLDPLVLLPGITDNLTTNKHTNLFIFFAAVYYARKVILSKWKLPDPPTFSMEISGQCNIVSVQAYLYGA